MHVIAEKGYVPYIVRSDRGKETPLAAEVHYYLSHTMQNNPHFQLRDCWYYGTSTANQRIESWWSHLQKSQLYRWRVSNSNFASYEANNFQDYFAQLRSTGQFDKDSVADKIAMLAIYMPIIREAAIAYKDLWNIHTIRKQPNRPNAVSGQPEILYDFPPTGEGSYGVQIDPEFVQQIEAGLEEWGMFKMASPQLCPPRSYEAN